MSAVGSIISPRLTMRASFFALTLVALWLAVPGRAEVALSEKHLIILRAGLDSVWGDYIFSVQNNQQEAQQAEVTLFLPRETVDFKAIEGVAAADLRVDPQHGTVKMQKEFPHGATLVNIGFKVAAQGGNTTLHWVATRTLASLNIMYEHDIIDVSSDKLVATHLPRIADVHYRALHTPQALAKGDGLRVQVRGVPQGRAQLHLFAVVFAATLLISAAYLSIKTRPRVGEG